MKIINKQKPVILAAILAITTLIVIIALLLLSKTKLSDAEKIAVTDYSKPLVSHFDNFEPLPDTEIQPTEEQQYIAFALDYFHFEKSQDLITIDELANFIKDTFDHETNKDELEQNLQADIIVRKNIAAVIEDGNITASYPNPSKKERAYTPISYYAQTDIKKSHGAFEVSYDRYTIYRPYDMLNCLSETESENTSDFMAYLNTKSDITSAQKAISSECASKLAQPDSKLTIFYKIKDNKLYIENIKH
jgi:hypothetical protein